MSNLTKLTLNLTSRAQAALDNLTSESGDSKTDIVNRALLLYDFVMTELRTGQQLLVHDPASGKMNQIKLL